MTGPHASILPVVRRGWGVVEMSMPRCPKACTSIRRILTDLGAVRPFSVFRDVDTRWDSVAALTSLGCWALQKYSAGRSAGLCAAWGTLCWFLWHSGGFSAGFCVKGLFAGFSIVCAPQGYGATLCGFLGVGTPGPRPGGRAGHRTRRGERSAQNLAAPH